MRAFGTRLLGASLLCLVMAAPAAAADEETETCADCHDEVDAEAFAAGVHGDLVCIDCHEDADPLPHDDALAPVECAACHNEVVVAAERGVHARVQPEAGRPRPTCLRCHGDVHTVAPFSDPGSPVHALRQPETCGSCHTAAAPDARDGLHVIRPIEAYAASVHARALAGGKPGATCSSCHTGHAILPAADPTSPVNRANVVATCGTCHADIAAAFAESIHGRAAVEGVRESPVCTDCHGEHRILSPRESGSPVFATNVPLQTCGRCHGDLRLARKYDLPEAQVASYTDSYHGLASRAGIEHVANCASCHGVHDILPSTDPRSHVHPANLAATCGRCHPDAGKRYAIGPVHVLPKDEANLVAHWIRRIYLPLIWIVIGGMLLHNLLDLVQKARHPAWRALAAADRPARLPERMPIGFRLAHAAAAVTFVTLAVTGFALKYPESWWALPFSLVDGGAALRGSIHRVAALGLLAAVALHLVHLAISPGARRRIRAMTPRLADVSELVARVGYNLGLRREAPRGACVGYVEKVEYWAFMWGTLITAASGALLWLENLTLAWLPGWVPGAATALHLYEAILATLAIAVWHLYWVMLDPMVYPMDPTWLTGRPPLARAEERGELTAEPPARPEEPTPSAP